MSELKSKWEKKPEGAIRVIPCGGKCGYSTIVQVADCDPSEARCTHSFYWDDWCDNLDCANCGLRIEGRHVRVLKVMGKQEFTKKHDELVGRLAETKNELTEVLAENARLRRQVDGPR